MYTLSLWIYDDLEVMVNNTCFNIFENNYFCEVSNMCSVCSRNLTQFSNDILTFVHIHMSTIQNFISIYVMFCLYLTTNVYSYFMLTPSTPAYN